jgi:hypothetical protein
VLRLIAAIVNTTDNSIVNNIEYLRILIDSSMDQPFIRTTYNIYTHAIFEHVMKLWLMVSFHAVAILVASFADVIRVSHATFPSPLDVCKGGYHLGCSDLF